MPQTFTAKFHHLITCAANDLVTINWPGGLGKVAFKNDGPGKVYISLDPAVAATVGGTSTIFLGTGDTYYDDRVGKGSYGTKITMIADTAATIVGVTF